VFGHALI
jgi:hypothetical protein